MVNLAIIIAVSQYSGDAAGLPACSQDGKAVAEVLRASGRFNEILQLDSDTSSTTVKQKLAEFAENFRDKQIDEIFFYFTGHGEFDSNNFYYLLSDYQTKKIRQTSLENSELDSIIRKLSPTLFVKVVDACYSGMTYIKSPDAYNEYLKGTGQGFKKLYFMFSSQSTQSSYQNEEISFFTRSILNAICSHGINSIRYKDLIDYISDDFNELNVQTPLFVTQADFTEVFCDIDDNLRSLISKFVQVEGTKSDQEDAVERPPSIADVLRADAKRYASKQEAAIVVSTVVNHLQKSIGLHEELQELYDVELVSEDQAPPFSSAIGKWMEEYKGDLGYFIKPTYRTESYEEPRYDMFAMISNGRTETVTKYKKVVDGFTFTTDMPFNHIKITLKPKLPNLAPEECFIVSALSRTHIRFFWCALHLEYSDWDVASRVGKAAWYTVEAPLGDSEKVKLQLTDIITKFWNFVKEPLQARFKVNFEGGN